MSVLCPAQVTSRANTQLCAIDTIVNQRHVSSAARMVLIAAQVDQWRANTAGTTGILTAEREAGRLTSVGTVRTEWNRPITDADRYL